MKRYKIILGVAEGYPAISKAKMVEDPDGEYVKWEDVKDIISIPCNCKVMQEFGKQTGK